MSARADLCGGRSAMIVPTATSASMERRALGRIGALSDKSYKKECQEKNLPHRPNTHQFLSRHSAPLLERALLTECGVPQAEHYVSSPRAKWRFASSPPVGFISLS